jgi:ADP-heptose:LPS heptosyltransferase
LKNISRIEQLSRRIVVTLLRAAASRPRHAAKLQPGDLHRVLLIRYDRIGDAIITLPFITALKQIAPAVEIDVLASTANAAIFRNDPRVNEVYIWRRSWRQRLRLIRRCRARHYDAVFQLILGWTTLPSLLAGALAPVGRIIGKSAPGREYLFDHAAELPHDIHFADRTLAVLGVGVDLEGVELPPISYSIPIGPREREHARQQLWDAGLHGGEFILLNISARSDRLLTDEQNITLASRLAALGCDVVVSGTPDAAARAQRIAEEGGPRVVALTSSSLMQAIALMAEARLIVTPDTGVVHMASAVGRPIVVMFPRGGDPVGWGPRGVPYRIVQATRGETVQEVNLDEVVECAAELLAAARRERGSGKGGRDT